MREENLCCRGYCSLQKHPCTRQSEERRSQSYPATSSSSYLCGAGQQGVRLLWIGLQHRVTGPPPSMQGLPHQAGQVSSGWQQAGLQASCSITNQIKAAALCRQVPQSQGLCNLDTRNCAQGGPEQRSLLCTMRLACTQKSTSKARLDSATGGTALCMQQLSISNAWLQSALLCASLYIQGEQALSGSTSPPPSCTQQSREGPHTGCACTQARCRLPCGSAWGACSQTAYSLAAHWLGCGCSSLAVCTAPGAPLIIESALLSPATAHGLPHCALCTKLLRHP